jgi:hypothetical protein
MRLRGLILLLGALLVAATYSFPLWVEFLLPGGESAEVFPGLPRALEDSFLILPPDQQAAYRAVSARDRVMGATMLISALSPRIPAPEDERDLPDLNAPVIVAVGSFQRLDAIRWGQGDVTIYAQTGGLGLLRLENFSVANGPDLRLLLSTSAEPQVSTGQLSETDDLDLGPLKGTYGNQHYELPTGTDIREFRSVMLYSPSLQMVYSIAPLFLRG